MAKILITSLGTGEKDAGSYRSACYVIEGKEYETSFVADALNRHIGFERIFLVGTRRSIWDEAYRVFGDEETIDERYLENLFDKKEEAKIDTEALDQLDKELDQITPVIIDYGLDETELWSNFEHYLAIAKELKDGDEVYLDITHSFRSLSLMSFVMTRFARSISDKRLIIGGVYYGMLEYTGENNGKTPIVDIKILIEFADWIEAINAIKHYSDFTPLIDLMDRESIDSDAKKVFDQLHRTLALANFATLQTFFRNAESKIKQIKKSNNPIVKLLVPEIEKILSELSRDKQSDFQFALAKWLHNNQNYALSYIALYEAIITKSCELKGYDVNDHKQREEAKKRIGDDKYGKFFYANRPDSISRIRNAIVHQGSERKDLDMQDINRLDNFLKEFESYFKIG